MIRVNFDKAKAAAHDIRRAKRAGEFEPLDKIVALQIPGVDYAEKARQDIRDKYAVVQQGIDAAVSVEELKTIVDSLEISP